MIDFDEISDISEIMSQVFMGCADEEQDKIVMDAVERLANYFETKSIENFHKKYFIQWCDHPLRDEAINNFRRKNYLKNRNLFKHGPYKVTDLYK